MKIILFALLLAGPVACQRPAPARPTAPRTVVAAPAAVLRLAYGPDSRRQFGELRLPAGPGPFPVVVVLHGGCWLAQSDLTGTAPLCEALTRAGYAVSRLSPGGRGKGGIYTAG